uniref:Prostaglandin reductase 3 n=1 Tax=Oncorhynchus mykiss TaxID=8022 RepID=A0A8K9WT32_ONCMY
MSTSFLLRNGKRVFSVIGGGCRGTDALSRVHFVSRRFIIDLSYSTHFMDFKGSSIPSSMKKLVVTKLSQNFRDAVALQTVPVPTPGDGDLLVRNRFVGINASDINYSAGRYDPSVKPPFDAGFEGIGEVVGLGLSASARYTIGDTVAYFADGTVPVPAVKPEFLTLLLSGATAYIAMKRLGDLVKGETVLVTAAKAGFLKTIGCDRPINYTSEDLSTTLRKEYPQGLDVVYESIGGRMFDMAVNNLANEGRLIVIGFISVYQTATGVPTVKGGTLPMKLLQKSASVRGFFLPHFLSDYKEAMGSMMQMFAKGKLVCEVDCGDMAPEGRFMGLESVFRAVDYMYAGKNVGKVVVEVTPPSLDSKLWFALMGMHWNSQTNLMYVCTMKGTMKIQNLMYVCTLK